MDSFGASAPAPVLFEHFGFSLDNVVAVAREALNDKT
jgi:transketolase